jgi:lysine 2,3-aminomutase
MLFTRPLQIKLPTLRIFQRKEDPCADLNLFATELKRILARVAQCPTLATCREELLGYVSRCEVYAALHDDLPSAKAIQIRDCARALRSIFSRRSDRLAGFSVAQTLWGIAKGEAQDNLTPAFFSDLIHLVQGVEGRGPDLSLYEFALPTELTGRDAALERSLQLDQLWEATEKWFSNYPHGLLPEVGERRALRRKKITEILGASPEQWEDWRWQVANIIKDPSALKTLLPGFQSGTLAGVEAAREGCVPFGITPFYLSLMDDSGADRALRAQVFPSKQYVETVCTGREAGLGAIDFMQETDTSPVDLVTRRYPMIAILKPFNSCPQICVYCQRNWEIEEVMEPSALASPVKLDEAISWIVQHPAIREILITGGDPLALDDETIDSLLGRLAQIKSIERIRIGTRTLVTIPMRFTSQLASLLSSYRQPGEREIAVVTHIEHPYEINWDTVAAVERLRKAGISVYNQMVFTFFNSRRFEACELRRLLKRCGIDPYYSFNMKGKEETNEYRVPLARLLQELKEEARMLPGLDRTDSAVYNLPRLGKNHLRAQQHRDLLSILPDGSRIYEFHPWEKNIARQETYVTKDIPILDYLERLTEVGEDPKDYESIWYYF